MDDYFSYMQGQCGPVDDELNEALDKFFEKFGYEADLAVDESYGRDELIGALEEAVRTGEPGEFARK